MLQLFLLVLVLVLAKTRNNRLMGSLAIGLFFAVFGPYNYSRRIFLPGFEPTQSDLPIMVLTSFVVCFIIFVLGELVRALLKKKP